MRLQASKSAASTFNPILTSRCFTIPTSTVLAILAALVCGTSASVSAGSNWTRNSLAASVGFDHYQFLSLPSESFTSWNIGLAGGYTIADSQLLVAYSHQSYYQLSTTLATVRSTTPVLNNTDSIGLAYTFNFGELAVTPNMGISAYRFGAATASGVTFNQDYLNYNSFAAGVTARYAINDQSGVLAVVRALDSVYLSPQPGQPSNDSTSLLLLAGLDYQAKSVWRYRVLGGIEVRKFSASRYPTKIAPDIEGSVIWNPTGLTTINLSLASAIEAPQTIGTNGFVLTEGHVVIDHELKRNVFLQGRGAVQHAQFLPRGTETQFRGGAGVSWLLNRAARLVLDYDYITATTDGSSTSTTSLQTQTVGQYSQSLITLTLHLAL